MNFADFPIFIGQNPLLIISCIIPIFNREIIETFYRGGCDGASLPPGSAQPAQQPGSAQPSCGQVWGERQTITASGKAADPSRTTSAPNTCRLPKTARSDRKVRSPWKTAGIGGDVAAFS
jgi:hypothetical protein